MEAGLCGPHLQRYLIGGGAKIPNKKIPSTAIRVNRKSSEWTRLFDSYFWQTHLKHCSVTITITTTLLCHSQALKSSCHSASFVLLSILKTNNDHDIPYIQILSARAKASTTPTSKNILRSQYWYSRRRSKYHSTIRSDPTPTGRLRRNKLFTIAPICNEFGFFWCIY